MLALKANVIVQLTMLAAEIAQAVATAAVTFGASPAEIPNEAFRNRKPHPLDPNKWAGKGKRPGH